MSTRSGTSLTPIRRRPLHEEVAARLRDLIIEGRLPAGARLVETELGAKFGVSRTPLREAIRTLAGEGLVDLAPAKGAVVRRFSLDDVRHMLEAIAVIEHFAAQKACERASDEEIAGIVRLHLAMMVQYGRRRRLAYYKLNQAIHTAIVAAAHNPEMGDMHERLQARMKRIRYIGNQEPEKWAGAVVEHEQMIEALQRRDGTALAEVMLRHLRCTLERVRDAI